MGYLGTLLASGMETDISRPADAMDRGLLVHLLEMYPVSYQFTKDVGEGHQLRDPRET